MRRRGKPLPKALPLPTRAPLEFGYISADDPWRSHESGKHDLEALIDARAARWTGDPWHVAKAVGAACEPGEVSCAAVPNGLIVTHRVLGVHARVDVDPRTQEWTARLWRIPAAMRAPRWLLDAYLYRRPSACAADVPLQDLAVACLDVDTPDRVEVLSAPPGARLDEVDGPQARGAGADSVWAALCSRMLFAQVLAACQGISSGLGPHATLGAVDPGNRTRRILAGTWHGYPWQWVNGAGFRIVPPGRDPAQAPWWECNVRDLDELGVLPAAGIFDLSDAHVPELLDLLATHASPAPWRYWFAETFRGRDVGDARPPALLPDGTPVWVGIAQTPEQARVRAVKYAWDWGIRPLYTRGSGDPHPLRRWPRLPGDPRETWTRNRDRQPRRAQRIALAEHPVHADPRDFSAYAHPARTARG